MLLHLIYIPLMNIRYINLLNKRNDRVRLYGSIQTKFWIHSDMQNASDQAKLLAVYLLSSMHTNMLGCFRIPVAYVSDDLKWSIDKVNHALDELSRIHFLSWDADSSYVFIHQFLKFMYS